MKVQKTEIGGYLVTATFVASTEGEAVAMLDSFKDDECNVEANISAISPSKLYTYEQLLKLLHAKKVAVVEEGELNE